MRIFLILLLCSLLSCSKSSKVEEHFSSYLKSVYTSDYNESYKYLTEKEKKKWGNSENYLNKFGNKDLLKTILSDSSFVIKSVNIENGLATLIVEENIPDLKSVFQDLFLFISPYRSSASTQQLELMLKTRLTFMKKNNKISYVLKLSTYKMKKEGKLWRIVKEV